MITTKNNKSFNEEENFNRFKELNFLLNKRNEKIQKFLV